MKRMHIHVTDEHGEKMLEVRSVLEISVSETVRRALDSHLHRIEATLQRRRDELKRGAKMPPKNMRKGAAI